MRLEERADRRLEGTVDRFARRARRLPQRAGCRRRDERRAADAKRGPRFVHTIARPAGQRAPRDRLIAGGQRRRRHRRNDGRRRCNDGRRRRRHASGERKRRGERDRATTNGHARHDGLDTSRIAGRAADRRRHRLVDHGAAEQAAAPRWRALSAAQCSTRGTDSVNGGITASNSCPSAARIRYVPRIVPTGVRMLAPLVYS